MAQIVRKTIGVTVACLLYFLSEEIHAQESTFEDGFQQQCNLTIKEGQGIISSPDFRTSYPNNLNCRWSIEVEQGRTVMLSFIYFDVESSSNCQYDSVSVFNGPSTDHPLLGRLCGPFRPGRLVSTSNRMLVTMETDGSNSKKGFVASFISDIPTHADEGSCGGLMTTADGSFHSPNYPKSNYPPSVTCSWHIKVDTQANIDFSFEEMDIEKSTGCKYDAVVLYAGWSNTDKTKFIGRYCGGNDDVPSIITSPGNELFVTFISDASGFAKGFRAVYTSKAPTTTTTTASTTIATTKPTQSSIPTVISTATFACPTDCPTKIKLKSTVCKASYIVAIKVRDPKSIRTRGVSPGQILKIFKSGTMPPLSTITMRIACPRCVNMSKGSYLIVGTTTTEDGIEIRPGDLVSRYKERKHTKQVEKFVKRCKKGGKNRKKKRRAGSKKKPAHAS